MEKRNIRESELVLNSSGRIYHLNLLPEEIANTVFLVGDPGRVKLMSSMFDSVEVKVENREFVTHTGTLNGRRISVVSTGIGTDNIDIVVNELDALVNIDLDTRKVCQSLTSLNLIRIGTSGALHADMPPGSVITSNMAGGLDNLMHFYGGGKGVFDHSIMQAFKAHMKWEEQPLVPYFIPCSEKLFKKVRKEGQFHGITLAAPGFYAPQGRSLRLPLMDPEFIAGVSSFTHKGMRVNNFEMEGSALYGLSRLLGHEALTVCISLANRITGDFLTDYKPQISGLLEHILKRMTDDPTDGGA